MTEHLKKLGAYPKRDKLPLTSQVQFTISNRFISNKFNWPLSLLRMITRVTVYFLLIFRINFIVSSILYSIKQIQMQLKIRQRYRRLQKAAACTEM
jgi:hypothetical protein